MKPLSVTSLNLQIKSLLESTFTFVYVEGEISNLTYHNSGHIYFSIKDEDSSINCVMFRGNAKNLKFKLENGMKIIITGSITLYAPRGSYQIVCQKISPYGEGELSLAFEQLKEKLKKEGLFDQKYKKELPKFPKKIAIVTSATGAAIEDIKRVAKNRYPLCKLILVPTLVQGECKEDIVESIKFADSLNCDIIIVGRGGGSIEDLWGFNEEIVARAIFEAKTPIISAVGHEIDYTISDFVADVRASTPSNAIEIALPNSDDLRLFLISLENDFNSKMKFLFSKKEYLLTSLKEIYSQNSIFSKLNAKQNEIVLLKENFTQKMLNFFSLKNAQVQNLILAFENSKKTKQIKKGFAQISKENRVIDLEELKIMDEFELQNNKISIKALVKNKKNIV